MLHHQGKEATHLIFHHHEIIKVEETLRTMIQTPLPRERDVTARHLEEDVTIHHLEEDVTVRHLEEDVKMLLLGEDVMTIPHQEEKERIQIILQHENMIETQTPHHKEEMEEIQTHHHQEEVNKFKKIILMDEISSLFQVSRMIVIEVNHQIEVITQKIGINHRQISLENMTGHHDGILQIGHHQKKTLKDVLEMIQEDNQEKMPVEAREGPKQGTHQPLQKCQKP